MKTIVKALAEETRTVTENGKRVKFTYVELLINALLAKTMEGDITAIKYLEGLREKLEPQDINVGFLLCPEPLDAKEWIRRAEILNRFNDGPNKMEIHRV